MTAAMALCGIGCKLCIIGVALIGFQSVVLILGAAVHGCVGVCVCVCVRVCVRVCPRECMLPGPPCAWAYSDGVSWWL